jgi:hypothetical protein
MIATRFPGSILLGSDSILPGSDSTLQGSDGRMKTGQWSLMNPGCHAARPEPTGRQTPEFRDEFKDEIKEWSRL